MDVPTILLNPGERDVPLAEPPSFIEQCPWSIKAGYFDFGRAVFPGVDYFNCGIVTRDDGDWLIVRRSTAHKVFTFGINDIMAFFLDPKPPSNGKYLSHGVKIKIPTSQAYEQFEDPRAIYHDGKVWLSCCNFVWNVTSWTGAHQVLAQVNKDWNTVKRYDIPYGKNGDGLGKNTGHEKNWLWFFHNDKPYLLYHAQPHTIIRFNNDFVIEEEYKTEHPALGWKWGQIRGGTPPVRIGNEYWTFFHSSVPWTMRKRRYVMAAYAFEAKPPFQMTRMSVEPILVGSWRDRWADKKPLVIFSAGAILRDGVWTVTFGVNDMCAGYIDLPHKELAKRTPLL